MMAIKYKIDECGIFRDEIKNRFRSIVTINNQDVMCYIESSSRLDNYINLKDKKIFLQKINNKSLKYKVFMLPYRYDKILLCPMMANKIVASEFAHFQNNIHLEKLLHHQNLLKCYRHLMH